MDACKQLFAAGALIAVVIFSAGAAHAQQPYGEPGAPPPYGQPGTVPYGQPPVQAYGQPPMQPPPPGPAAFTTADRAMQIAQAREANAALMHHFSWNSRTEILKDGQVKDTRIEVLYYGQNGVLQRNLLNDQKAGGFYLPTPIGFLRRAIAKNEAEDLEKFLNGLKGLLDQYTLPTAGKILDFMTTARPTGPDANGLYSMSGGNVVDAGRHAHRLRQSVDREVLRMTVNTSFRARRPARRDLRRPAERAQLRRLCRSHGAVQAVERAGAELQLRADELTVRIAFDHYEKGNPP